LVQQSCLTGLIHDKEPLMCSRRWIPRTVLVALALALASSQAYSDGGALLPVDDVMQGCPGEVVVFNVLANYDNCALQLAAPPLGGCAIAYVSVTSNGPGNYAGAFVPAPLITGPRLPCTPPVGGAGSVQQLFQVTVAIPANANPGDTDNQTVQIGICGVTAQVELTVNVVPCGEPPQMPGAGTWSLVSLASLMVLAGLFMLSRRARPDGTNVASGTPAA
jgi:hypothetical protein